MSGVLRAVIAVLNLSCAASQGIAVTLTVPPGLAAWNFLARSGSFSPSAPMAHTVRVPVAAPDAMLLVVPPLVDCPLLRPHAGSAAAVGATRAAERKVLRRIRISLSLAVEGSAGRRGQGRGVE